MDAMMAAEPAGYVPDFLVDSSRDDHWARIDFFTGRQS